MRAYVSRPNRKPVALLAGALIGATGVAVWAALSSSGMIFLFPLFFIVALIVWSVGLVLLGIPLWFVFERVGWTSPVAAVALGLGGTAVGTVLAQLMLLRDAAGVAAAGREIVSPRSLSGLLAEALGWLPLGLLGGLVGFSIWRLSYERTPRS